jgi:RHS repeat-associated protein
MQFSRSALLGVIITIVQFGAMPALCQDPPDVAMGMNPQATYQVGDFDSVDMATGRVNLNIPLIQDRSQRGQLNFTYSLDYSSTSSWTKIYTGLNSYYWSTGRYGIQGPTLIADGLVTGTRRDQYRDPDTKKLYYSYSLLQGNNAVHPYAGLHTLDGSGIQGNAVVYKNGVRGFSPLAGYTIEDANGNQMVGLNTIVGTNINNTMTDTLGRSWTLVPGSTNVTGCPVGPVPPTTATTWTTPGPSGGARLFKFCYAQFSDWVSYQGGTLGTLTLMTGVVLPDLTTWRLDYENGSSGYGNLTAVYPPTGGAIYYTWATTNDGAIGSYFDRVLASRRVFDGTNSYTWNYPLNAVPDTYGTAYLWSGTVTDPLGNDTVGLPAHEPNGIPTGMIATESHYSGRASGGQLLKTVTKTYQDLPNPYLGDISVSSSPPDPQLLLSTTTAWPNGLTSKVQQTYDAGFTFVDSNYIPSDGPAYYGPFTSSYGLPTSVTTYDYGNGAAGQATSTTNTNYLAFSNSSYMTANILDLPSSQILLDGNGNKCAETDYAYDASAQIVPSGVTMQHVPAPTPGVLGNLTSIKRQLYSNPCQSVNPTGTPLTTNQYVYDTGMLQKSADPLTNPTTYSYSGIYYGAYPTTITNALNQSTTYTYDFNTGLMASMTDPNGQTTSFPSYDSMLRPTQANYPDGGQTTIAYNYSGNVFTGGTVTKKITSSLNMVTTQIFDGLGRPKQTKATVPTSTCSSGFSYVDTSYDSDGRTFSVSNTYCTTGDATYGLTKTYYDALNRPCLVVPPDGTVPSGTSCPGTPTANDIVTAYLGNATTVTDQVGNQRRSISDALGRLVEVNEPGPGSGTGTDASGVVGIYGSEQLTSLCCPGVWDTGTVWITVNNFTKSAAYGQNSTPSSIATALASAFNADNNSPVTTSVNGIYVTLTSKTTGTSSDYPVSVGSNTSYPAYVSGPSFRASPASPTLNCGSSGSATVYSVCTPTVTKYTYNTLDELTQVLQAGSRQRTFAYDSLSRLTQAKNPESGIINYAYDANGNLLTKTDARGITINYSPSELPIDPLNRVRKKTYSNGDPAVTYAYDGNAPAGCSPTLSITYGIGRRTAMCDAAGSEAWSYDKMGRVAVDQRKTNGVTKSTTYGYNFNGSMGTLNYPSGRTVTYTPNSAAQPISAVDTANSVNYATMALYAPQGDLRSILNGNGAGILSTFYYNNRLQPCRIALNSSGTGPGSCGDGTNHGNVLDYAYSFDHSAVNAPCSTSFTSPTNNGDVASIADNITSAKGQNFCYDVVNRLSKAETVSTSGANCWGEQYGYDNWGNLLSITALTPQYNGCTQESGFSIAATANNQIAGFCYDADGNLLAQSAPPCPSPTYTYNGENQLISTGGVTYTYDGDGRRIQKSNGKLLWYETSGNVLDETDAGGNVTYEYVFFGGKRIARRDSSGNVEYYFADHLGSTRVVTNASGGPLETCTYYPFGGSNCLPSSVNNYLFTGKERDSESGLDNFGARYNSSQYGRFMTPDPENAGADLTNPQSWNMYTYVQNNPLNAIDPNGLDCIYVTHTTQEDHTFVQPGDCTSDKDDGYFVNGTVTWSTVSPDGNYLGYTYQNYPEDDPTLPQFGQQCVGTCPATSITVQSGDITGVPTMSAPSHPGTLIRPPEMQFQRPTTFWERLAVAAGCTFGLDAELMDNGFTPNNGNDRPEETQFAMGKYKVPFRRGTPGRPPEMNKSGKTSAEAMNSAAAGAALASNQQACLQNASGLR